MNLREPRKGPVQSHLDRKLLEARIGVEPTNKGFADLCLTTWLPRPGCFVDIPQIPCRHPQCQPALQGKAALRLSGTSPRTSRRAFFAAFAKLFAYASLCR